MASGEYFLNKEQKKAKLQKEKEEKHAEAAKQREEKRQQAFVPPEEPSTSKTANKINKIDVEAIKAKIKKAQGKNSSTKIFNSKNKH